MDSDTGIRSDEEEDEEDEDEMQEEEGRRHLEEHNGFGVLCRSRTRQVVGPTENRSSGRRHGDSGVEAARAVRKVGEEWDLPVRLDPSTRGDSMKISSESSAGDALLSGKDGGTELRGVFRQAAREGVVAPPGRDRSQDDEVCRRQEEAACGGEKRNRSSVDVDNGERVTRARSGRHQDVSAVAHREGAPEQKDLQLLLQRLRAPMAAAAHLGGHEEALDVDMSRAQYLLEASAGDVNLAERLYWENYLAAASSTYESNPLPPRAAPFAADEPSGPRRHHATSDAPDRSSPPLRARSPSSQNGAGTDVPLQSALHNRSEPASSRLQPQRPSDEDGAPIADADMPTEHQRQPDAPQAAVPVPEADALEVSRHTESAAVQDSSEPDPDGDGQANQRPEENANNVESVSVSDDEGGNASSQRSGDNFADEAREAIRQADRMKGRLRDLAQEYVDLKVLAGAYLDDEIDGGFVDQGIRSHDDDTCHSCVGGKLRKDNADLDVFLNEELDEEYDYLAHGEDVDGSEKQLSSRLQRPSNVLWGGWTRVTADVLDDDAASKSTIHQEGMPPSWVNAGFSLSNCASGLLLHSPPDADLLRLRRQRTAEFASAGTGGSPPPPPPHHCGGITAVLALITSLLYAGTTVQGTEVSCNSDRTPFGDLGVEEKQREFEGRLADALTSVLFINAKEVLIRRQRALADLERRFVQEPAGWKRKNAMCVMSEGCEPSKGKTPELLGPHVLDANRRRIQLMRRRLRLLHVCRWDKERDRDSAGFGEPLPADVRVSVSSTHMDDLHAFVLSNMRFWTAPGGCALFLETIVRMHGVGRVRKMLKLTESMDAASPGPLLTCRCDERHLTAWAKMRRAGKNSAGHGESHLANQAQLPAVHECISDKVLGLLLTGGFEVMREWNVGRLGIGVITLTDCIEDNDPSVRAYRPVSSWLLRGDRSYSSLVQTSEGTTPLKLMHWNCWYGIRNRTSLKVNGTGLSSAFRDGREVSKRWNVASAVESVVINPDDQKFYPKDYRRWRFDLGGISDTNIVHCISEGEDDKGITVAMEKSKAQDGEKSVWVPFIQLDCRQRQIVEEKLAPRILSLLRSKWPNATVDSFEPDDSSPVV